jgi:hypothetical protein
MGADIGPVRGRRSPRFALLAFRDPGTPGTPGTPLQLAQIVKGWVDAGGQTHEKVFDIAGDANNGATVDTATCTTSGPGANSLCAVWIDPEFNPDERAFYYARILENPTCRWSTYHCNNQGIDCGIPASVPAEYAECCNPAVAKTIQERAWSAPIWYRPEGVALARGQIRFGDQPQHDTLHLRLTLGAMPVGIDLATQDLTVAVRDDDDVYRVTIPAGTLQQRRPGLFVWNDATGAIGGIRSVVLQQRSPRRVAFRLRTVPLALPNADRVDHFVEVSLRGGTADITTTRLWQFNGSTLAAKN